MLDNFSIHQAPFAADTFRQILNSSSIANSHLLNLNTSRSIELYDFLYIGSAWDFSHFLQSLSIETHLCLSQTPQTQPLHFPTWSSTQIKFSSYGMILFLSCIMHFIFWPKFWVFEKFLGFFKIDEVFAKFLVGFCLNEF